VGMDLAFGMVGKVESWTREKGGLALALDGWMDSTRDWVVSMPG